MVPTNSASLLLDDQRQIEYLSTARSVSAMKHGKRFTTPATAADGPAVADTTRTDSSPASSACKAVRILAGRRMADEQDCLPCP